MSRCRERRLQPAKRLIGWSILALFGLLPLLSRPARAQEVIAPDDLKTIARALNFVDSLPRSGIAMGVLYSGDTPGTEALATTVVAEIKRIAAGVGLTLKPSAIDVKDLTDSTGQLNALLVLPGVAQHHADAIADAVRRGHLVSISTDPVCSQSSCCILFVQSAPRVEVVLNTQLAEAVGAHFSPIFAVMVTRR